MMQSVLQQFLTHKWQPALQGECYDVGVIRTAAAESVTSQPSHLVDVFDQALVKHELFLDWCDGYSCLVRSRDVAGVALVCDGIRVTADQGRQCRVAQFTEQVLIFTPVDVTHSASITQPCVIVNTDGLYNVVLTMLQKCVIITVDEKSGPGAVRHSISNRKEK